MADEIEIKLALPPDRLKTVADTAWLQAALCGPVTKKRLRSVYFDTAKRGLQAAGLTLRVRHSGKTRLQTVKASRGAVFARQEWECPITGDRPNLKALPKAAQKRFAKIGGPYRPVFETAVTRTILPLQWQGAVIELALDKGAIKTAKARAPISEIEIELKEGPASALVDLAKHLALEFAVTLDLRAKSDRGYALAAGASGAPQHAKDVALTPQMTVSEAFRAIGMECLRHLTANEAAVCDASSDGVHQMRVGLRRLRAAFSLFKDMLGDKESQDLKAELTWLCGALSPARDFDVFLNQSVAPLADSVPAMAVLQEDMQSRRDAGFARAKAAVQSARYRALTLGTALFLADGAWAQSSDLMQRARCDRPAPSFARETLKTRHAKVVKKAKKLNTLAPPERHKLRITIKKLRYASEFFGALFGAAKKQKAMASRLETLQEALGRLNDFAIHKQIAGEITGPARRPREAYAIGIVAGHEEAEAGAFLTAAKKAGARLKNEKAFWA